ncbi:MAG: aldehyde dehydrogenase family protein, partial [Pseudomonadales bacterium]|nr:aldehyde dehydrogenase family protein [Pseudomonadales bacterium]
MKEKSSIEIINPANGEVIDSVPIASKKDVELTAAIARQAALQCRLLSRLQRSKILSKTAQLIALEKFQFAKLITQESGKTITQSSKEVERCINTFELAAEEAKRHVGEVIPFDAYAGSENRQGYFSREPLGVVVAITPFNDPLNLVAHNLAQAIATGNSILLKPSE